MEMQITATEKEIFDLFQVDWGKWRHQDPLQMSINGVNFNYWINTAQKDNDLWFSSSGSIHKGQGTLTIQMSLENLDQKKLQEAKSKVQQAQKEFKKAQRELSKLQEKAK